MTTTELKEFNPFKLAGTELQMKVEVIKIETFEDTENAKIILKECTDLEKKIEDTRTSITKPVNDMLKQINNMAKEVAIPVNEAKNALKKKIIDFNEEQEKIKKAEDERIQRIVSKVLASVDEFSLNIFTDALEEKDKNNYIIKTAIENQKTKIEEKIRQEAEEKIRQEEQAKLEEEKKNLSEEQAKLAEEKLKIEQEKREIEEEKIRQAKEKELQEKNKIVEQINKTNSEKVKGIRTNTKREIIDENLVPKNLCSPDSKKINEYIKNIPNIQIPGIKIREEKTIQ